jgi:hypothetical protein
LISESGISEAVIPVSGPPGLTTRRYSLLLLNRWGVPSGDWQPHDGSTTDVSALLFKLRYISNDNYDHHRFSSLEVTIILVAIATLLTILISRLIIFPSSSEHSFKNTNQQGGFQHVNNDDV